MPINLQVVDRLFHEALTLPPEHRKQYLAEHCSDDATRAEVEAMLAHDGQAPGTLGVRTAHLDAARISAEARRGEVTRLLLATLDAPPNVRAEFLLRHCGDATIRTEVQSGLSATSALGDILGVSPHNAQHLLGSCDKMRGRSTGGVAAVDIPWIRSILPDPHTGQPRWEILDVKQGGMSLIYVGVDLVEGQPFAAKTYPNRVYAEVPMLAEGLEQEAAVWLAIPAYGHIAAVRGVHTIGGKPYLFMSYYPQGDLSALIGSPQMKDNLPAIVDLAIQICDGLEHAYRHGVVAHRDVKPSNCLLCGHAFVALTDFGLAKPVGTDRDLFAGYGTAEYLAPEQWADDAKADQRADVYAVGATLFEMVAGRKVHGDARHLPAGELRRRHEAAPVARLDGAPSSLNAVVQECMCKDVSRRYQSINQVREALSRVLHELTGIEDPGPLSM